MLESLGDALRFGAVLPRAEKHPQFQPINTSQNSVEVGDEIRGKRCQLLSGFSGHVLER